MAQLDSLVVIRFQVCIFDILNTAASGGARQESPL